MPTGTIRLHRVLRANPERVYRAFLDADAMAKWLPPYGFTCKVHHMDARVGGTYRMSFTNFTTGQAHSFGGEYRELVPFEKIRYTDRFDDPNLPGEMQTTVTLKQVSCGTEIERGAGRGARSHSARDVLSRLAGVARTACAARRARDSGVTRFRGHHFGEGDARHRGGGAFRGRCGAGSRRSGSSGVSCSGPEGRGSDRAARPRRSRFRAA